MMKEVGKGGWHAAIRCSKAVTTAAPLSQAQVPPPPPPHTHTCIPTHARAHSDAHTATHLILLFMLPHNACLLQFQLLQLNIVFCLHASCSIFACVHTYAPCHMHMHKDSVLCMHAQFSSAVCAPVHSVSCLQDGMARIDAKNKICVKGRLGTQSLCACVRTHAHACLCVSECAVQASHLLNLCL